MELEDLMFRVAQEYIKLKGLRDVFLLIRRRIHAQPKCLLRILPN